MIDFSDLALPQEDVDALTKLNIDYVFQPIFEADGKTVYAHEALMRPKDMTVTELIELYHKQNKLHIIEVATFFGAMKAYFQRGYKEPVSINSFPSDCISSAEAEEFWICFGEGIRGKMIVEILEYPDFSEKHWKEKEKSVRFMGNKFSLDDYGAGINDMDTVKHLKPDIVKLDRSLVEDIDKNPAKQEYCRRHIELLHEQNVKIVAEGVETKEEFDYLVSLGADLFQGYYLARPA